MQSTERQIIPLLAVAAIVAGLWWIPVRALEQLGFDGSWAITVMAAGAVPALVFCLIVARVPMLPVRAYFGATIIGLAVVLYSAALVETTVLRALVFFYLAPLWSMLIEIVWLKRPISPANVLAALLILFGIMLLQGFGSPLVGTFARGDLMAIMSGVAFAVGATLAFTTAQVHSVAFTLVVAIATVIIGAALAFALGNAMSANTFSGPTAGWIAAGSLIFFLPVMYVMSQASLLLPPSLVTMLLPLEIVSGFVSSLLWTPEPVSWTQGLGTLLISFAVLGTGVKIDRSPKAV